MSKDEIRIVDLPPMRCLRFHAFGSSPEHDAREKLQQWAKEGNHPKKGGEARLFGFNNPSPSPGSPNYGYEFWLEAIQLDADQTDPEQVAFKGGRYAVLRVQGVPAIQAGWARLLTWRETSQYQQGPHQWLEEHLSEGLDSADEDLVLDLCLPIAG